MENNVINFVSKEESQEILKEQRIQYLLNEFAKYNSKRTVKVIEKLLRGQKLVGNDRLIFSNSLIKIKLELRKYYKDIEKENDTIKGNQTYINYCNKILDNKSNYEIGYIKRVKEAKKYCEEDTERSRKIIFNTEKIIENNGVLLVDFILPNLDKYFTLDEIVQIVGGNQERYKQILHDDKCYKEKGLIKNTPLTATDIIVHHIEYQNNKQRCQDFFNAKPYEEPLCNTVWNTIVNKMQEYRKLNNKLDEEINRETEKLFGDTMVYSNGERVIQNLTARELIKKFTGGFISELKSSPTLDLEQVFRVKNFNNGTYAVIDKDGNILYNLYLK